MRDITARVLRARACAYACVRTGVCACACACAYRGACPPGLSDRSLWRLCVLQPSRRSEEHAAFYSRQDLSNRSLQRLKPTDPVSFCFDAARPCAILPAAALFVPACRCPLLPRSRSSRAHESRPANCQKTERQTEHEQRHGTSCTRPQHAAACRVQSTARGLYSMPHSGHSRGHTSCRPAAPGRGLHRTRHEGCRRSDLTAQRAHELPQELPAVGRGRGAQPAGPWARGLQGLCRTGAVRMPLPAYMPLWGAVIDSAGRFAPLWHSAPCTSRTAAVTHSVGLQRQNTRHTSCTHCRAVGCVPRSRAAASARACNPAASACVFASVGRCGAFCALFMRPVARGHRHEQNGPQQALQGLTGAKRHELHEAAAPPVECCRNCTRAARAAPRLCRVDAHELPQLVEVEGVWAVIEARSRGARAKSPIFYRRRNSAHKTPPHAARTSARACPQPCRLQVCGGCAIGYRRADRRAGRRP